MYNFADKPVSGGAVGFTRLFSSRKDAREQGRKERLREEFLAVAPFLATQRRKALNGWGRLLFEDLLIYRKGIMWGVFKRKVSRNGATTQRGRLI